MTTLLEPATVDLRAVVDRVMSNVEKVIVGKSAEVQLTLVGLLCQGHLLIEDVPGVGKTMLAKALARSIGTTFSRIQFTPDMLPSDVTGVSIFNQMTRQFEFRNGPIMAQIVLADEINRATHRGWRDAHASCAVYGAGDPEPHRIRRHFSAARGAIGPLPAAAVARLSQRRQ